MILIKMLEKTRERFIESPNRGILTWGGQTFVRHCTTSHGLVLAEGYQPYHARVGFPGNSAATPVNDGQAGAGLHRSPQLASFTTFWKV